MKIDAIFFLTLNVVDPLERLFTKLFSLNLPALFQTTSVCSLEIRSVTIVWWEKRDPGTGRDNLDFPM